MTGIQGRFVLQRDSGNDIEGQWRLEGEDLHVSLGQDQFCIPSQGDLRQNVERFVDQLGLQFGSQISLRACMNCNRFVMTGMARDMGRGQQGKCSLHQIPVEICFLCEDFDLEGGPSR